jgi:hypothetical protein
MTPQQLLKETQRTAGDANLTAWHNTLIEKGVDLKKSSKVSLHRSVPLRAIDLRSAIGASGRTQHMLQLKEKQKTLEKDIRRFQERQTIERQV